MAAGREIEAHERVAGLHQRHEHALIGLAAGIRLHIGEPAVEQSAGALDRQLLGDVDELAAAVVAPARIAFRVFVGHHRALRLEHRARDDVLRGDQLDLVALAAEFELDRAGDLRIGVGERRGKERVRTDGHGGGNVHRRTSLDRGLARRASGAGFSTEGAAAKGWIRVAGEKFAAEAEGQRPLAGAGENHHLVLGDAIEERVGLLVQEIPVDAFRPEAADARCPARVFVLQRGKLRLKLDGFGVEFFLRPQPVLAVRGAPYQVAARDPEHEVEDDRQHDLAQARPDDHAPILRGQR